MSTDRCIHIANICFLATYLCRDILWLRVDTCCGLLLCIILFCCQTDAMFAGEVGCRVAAGLMVDGRGDGDLS